MASSPSPRRGIAVDLALLRASPARKLRVAAQLPESMVGASARAHADRSYEYILQEEQERVLRARQARLRMGYPCAPLHSPPKEREAAGPEAAEEAAVAAQPRVRQRDSALQVERLRTREAATNTKPLASIAEQDELIEQQRAQIAELEEEVSRMRIAARGRIDDHRYSLARAQEVFYSAHRQMMADGVDQRRVFETASLMSLRDIEREREREILRQARRTLSDAASSPARCPSPAPASPALVLARRSRQE
eukprot:TRINITY_DN2301_c1_g1_i1.p2 TRINITY_DN2301_c1_g1~~TRINITY_DN2301_c1_g1_i1.p2  ORF type:complete len:251 (+),score=105.25 TRINITY_DN2301_c1_g1_i1:53-805(+)